MKKLVLMSVLMCSFMFANAQEPLSFSKVITCDSTATKSDIYSAIKGWIGVSFKSAKSVIEMEDKDAGLIVIRPSHDYYMKGLMYLGFSGYIRYTVKFQIKDGRYKVDVTNFDHLATTECRDCNVGIITTDKEYPYKAAFGAKGHMNKVWNDLKIKAGFIARECLENVSNIKISPSKGSTEDNW